MVQTKRMGVQGSVGRSLAAATLVLVAPSLAFAISPVEESARGAELSPTTVMQQFSIEEMAMRADFIVRARVLAIRTVEHPHQGSMEAWTEHTLAVEEVLKGALNRTITLSELGGEIRGRRLHIEGTPEYRVGDEAIIFLRRYPNGITRTFALSQGRFLIVRRGAEGDVALQDNSEVAFLVPTSSGDQSVSHISDGTAQALPLSDLVSRIRAALTTRTSTVAARGGR